LLPPRLHSHRSAITSLHFIPHPSASSSHPGYLLSTSLDTLLKLWDLQTSHCIQTVVAHRAAVHACHLRFVSPEHSEAGEEEGEERIAMGSWEVVTASGEGEVKGWLIKEDGLDQGIKEEEDGEVSF
jgi:U3 small nucleolar RNA-associated protein 12